MHPRRHSLPQILPLDCGAQADQASKGAAILEVLADLVHLLEELLPRPYLSHPQHPSRKFLDFGLLFDSQFGGRVGVSESNFWFFGMFAFFGGAADPSPFDLFGHV